MRHFLTLKQILLVKQPPHSPSLSLCVFIQFPATKPLLKGTHFGLLCSIMHHLLKVMSEVNSEVLPSAEGKKSHVLSCQKEKL
jgi:hypothetical protein